LERETQILFFSKSETTGMTRKNFTEKILNKVNRKCIGNAMHTKNISILQRENSSVLLDYLEIGLSYESLEILHRSLDRSPYDPIGNISLGTGVIDIRQLTLIRIILKRFDQPSS
jgi:hypothetical protein